MQKHRLFSHIKAASEQYTDITGPLLEIAYPNRYIISVWITLFKVEILVHLIIYLKKSDKKVRS